MIVIDENLIMRIFDIGSILENQETTNQEILLFSYKLNIPISCITFAEVPYEISIIWILKKLLNIIISSRKTIKRTKKSIYTHSYQSKKIV